MTQLETLVNEQPWVFAVAATILVVTIYGYWKFPLMKYRIKTYLRELQQARNAGKALYLQGVWMRHRVLRRVLADRLVDMLEDMFHKGELTKKQKNTKYRELGLALDIPDLIFSPGVEAKKARIRAEYAALQQVKPMNIPGPKPGEITTPKKLYRLNVVRSKTA